MDYLDVMSGSNYDELDKLIKDDRVDVLSDFALEISACLRERLKKGKKEEESVVINVTDFLVRIDALILLVFIDSLKMEFGNLNSIL